LGKLPRRELRAVHDKDLELFLERVGILEAIKEKQLTCTSCGSVISLENFGGVYPIGENIAVVCDKLECVAPLLRKKEG
jgi:hypothetical protein